VALERAAGSPRLPATLGVLVLGIAVLTAACGPRNGATDAAEASRPAPAEPPAYSEEARGAALSAARVWRAPDVPVGQAKLGENAPGEETTGVGDELSCRLVLEPVSGTTPKFQCELPGGEVVKIKYGYGANPELHAEVAASRLLRALGFGADRVHLVEKVRCAGCPALPFEALRCLGATSLEKPCFAGGVDYGQTSSFAPAAVERRFPGDPIETDISEGWAWYELDAVETARGGSPPADLDALRLIAVLLAHWDNKAANQRLVCLPGGRRADGTCGEPFAIIQDLGATFGPSKLDLRNWRAAPVWTDRRTCTISMASLPFGGSTFPERRVSEAGRRKLLGLVEQLSRQQLVDLFTGAGVTRYEHLDAEARDAGAWAAAFLDKVKQIREAGPCG
jgi:hypothetical protein